MGRRLQEERKTLGYPSQESLVLSVEKSKRTITNWESGTSFPDAADLLKLAAIGFDITYILFGTRSTMTRLDQTHAQYETPARAASAEIAGMTLSEEDAELLTAMARRLSKKG